MSNTNILRLLLMLAGYIALEEIQLANGYDSQAKVNCGCHIAESCAQCGTQREMCNGDCGWKGSKCVSKNGTSNLNAIETLKTSIANIADGLKNLANGRNKGQINRLSENEKQLMAKMAELLKYLRTKCFNNKESCESNKIDEFTSKLNSIFNDIKADASISSGFDKSFETNKIPFDEVVDVVKEVQGATIVKPSGTQTNDSWLVIAGGDNKISSTNGALLKSIEILTSTGVCKPTLPTTIPEIPKQTTAGEIAFLKASKIFVFCGGSTTFNGNSDPVSKWGATNLCYSRYTENTKTWSTTLVKPMPTQRAWFSLTAINDDEMIAVGGIDNSGSATNTMEKYSFGKHQWESITTTLPENIFGQCTLHYTKGGSSYLIIIGGSKKVALGTSFEAIDTVTKVDLLGNFKPTPLKKLGTKLFKPACTISGGDIFVTGGATGQGTNALGETTVYKYDVVAERWFTLGYLNTGRWGHITGMLGAGVNRKISVAGGFGGPSGSLSILESVEDSTDSGNDWSGRNTNLMIKREYAAAAQVPANTFTCQG